MILYGYWCNKCEIDQYDWIDKREPKHTIICEVCGSECMRQMSIPSTMFRNGGKYITNSEMTQAKDYTSKNAKDFLQPTYYDKQEKKVKLNKDFVKEYGNPFNKKAEVGTKINDN